MSVQSNFEFCANRLDSYRLINAEPEHAPAHTSIVTENQDPKIRFDTSKLGSFNGPCLGASDLRNNHLVPVGTDSNDDGGGGSGGGGGGSGWSLPPASPAVRLGILQAARPTAHFNLSVSPMLAPPPPPPVQSTLPPAVADDPFHDDWPHW